MVQHKSTQNVLYKCHQSCKPTQQMNPILKINYVYIFTSELSVCSCQSLHASYVDQ